MKTLILTLTTLLPFAAPALTADEVEFLSGARMQGTIKAIRKEAREFDLQVQMGGQTMVRTYPYDKVRSVTINGKTYVLSQTPHASGSSGSTSGTRSETDVLRLIDQTGPTKPDWYDSTPLDYPKTLDLSWPLKPPGKGWNNQKNMGQYLWDIIYPNPRRWHSGIRLVHHMMSLHKNNASLLRRDMQTLGGMYFRLLQDYPRAAYWLRQSRISETEPQRIMLAECYWRLGSKPLANRILSAKRLPLAAIKLLGDMGETQRAIQLANAFARQSRPQEAYLLAGDACRKAGQLDLAVRYYEKVIDAPAARNKDYTKRFRGRAADSIQAIQLYDRADVSRVADGTYSGISVGYNGDIEVEVTVKSGRIESVQIKRHNEKQFYAAFTDAVQQITRTQSVRNIDATSRATITAQAVVNAVAKALASGAK